MVGPRHGYLSSEAGAVAPIVAVSLVALIGMGGLAYDVSRGLALRSELENAVDAAALAGATQLDGSPGSLAKATAVARGALARNPQILADNAEKPNVLIDPNRDILFLSDLQNHTVTTDASEARFIQINLTPRKLGVLFGAIARAANFNVTAHAVAGFGTALCRAPPILICDPLGSGQPFNGDANIGLGMILHPAGNQAWQPGDYGLVASRSFTDQGGNPLRTGDDVIFDAIARVDPQIDCIGDTINVQPVTFQAADAFNVRFDIYKGQADALKALANYQPAMDSITGRASTTMAPDTICDPGMSTTVGAMPLPPDTCATGTNPSCSPALGDGTWDATTYFGVNHPNIAPGSVAGGATPTRFQVYQWELQNLAANNSIWGTGQQGSVTGGDADFALPRCNVTATQQVPDRRVISASVVDCTGISGPLEHVPVIARVDLFLTQPVDINNVIYAEVVGSTTTSSPAGRATLLTTARLFE